MLKKFLSLLFLPLLLAGCNATLNNLTPQQQVRNADNLYPVEIAFTSHQQTMRWQSIRSEIVVGPEFYKMRPTPLMTNRWEGLIFVPPGTSAVNYRYKVTYDYNAMGAPRTDSIRSPEYTLRIVDK